jgi:dTDP-4-amino-4,6-dideoxygalactose transaminase
VRKKIEHKLCQLHQRNYCLLTGNGTAGIALCLEALGLRGKGVAIPDSVCISVPLAVSFSGNRPVYLDINIDDLGFSCEGLSVRTPELDAIVAVHGYGSVCRISAIEAIAAQQGLPLIEDACLVQGGNIDGRPTGSFGIASVVSFGAGKPIVLGHGGAILTDDHHFYRDIKSLNERLPDFTAAADQAIDELGRAHTRLYNQHYGRDLAEHVVQFRRMALEARRHFLQRFNEKLLTRLEEALAVLPQEIELRWLNWRRLSQELISTVGEHIRILPLPPGSVPWRLNLLMDRRDQAMQALHKQGLHASSWHPPVSRFLEDDFRSGSTPISYEIGDRILNLWVVDYSEKYVQSVCATLQSFWR